MFKLDKISDRMHVQAVRLLIRSSEVNEYWFHEFICTIPNRDFSNIRIFISKMDLIRFAKRYNEKWNSGKNINLPCRSIDWKTVLFILSNQNRSYLTNLKHINSNDKNSNIFIMNYNKLILLLTLYEYGYKIELK